MSKPNLRSRYVVLSNLNLAKGRLSRVLEELSGIQEWQGMGESIDRAGQAACVNAHSLFRWQCGLRSGVLARLGSLTLRSIVVPL